MTLDVIIQEGLTPEVGPQQQESAKPIVTITSANSTVKRNPAYGDELAALENYNHIDIPSDFMVGRNAKITPIGRSPAYGDELADLENYYHVDIPNASARGPQLILDRPIDSGQVTFNKLQKASSAKSGSRATQFHPEMTYTLPVKSPQRENPKAELAQLEGRVKTGHLSSFQRGVQHERGSDGVRKNHNRTMEYYFKVAVTGNAETCYNIARLYEYDRGVSKNESQTCSTLVVK